MHTSQGSLTLTCGGHWKAPNFQDDSGQTYISVVLAERSVARALIDIEFVQSAPLLPKQYALPDSMLIFKTHCSMISATITTTTRPPPPQPPPRKLECILSTGW